MSAVSGIKSKNFVNYNQIKVGVCQVPVTADKLFNIEHVRGVITTACQVPCDMIVLPEIWNSPYATVSFPIYAEVLPSIGEQPKPIDSPSSTMMCEQAKKFGVYIIGGSIPEREIDSVTGEERIYNTCLVINPNGEIVGKFRKVHLFDIDVPGKIKFKESDSLTSGNDVCIVDTPWGLVGVGICYDIRFPELALIMRARGCKILIYPGAFNMITGPAHWELLSRARAVDNQVYVIVCSPARCADFQGYVAWGHSSVVAPFGEVIATAGISEEIIYGDLDMENVTSMRQNIPCWHQKRNDVYEVIDKTIEG